MSFNDLADITESIPLLRVIRELRERGFNTTAPDLKLRRKLAQAFLQKTNTIASQGSAQGRGTESNPIETMKDLRRDQVLGSSSMPEPPAESTRLNGAILRTLQHQGPITQREAVPRHQNFFNHP